MNEEDIFDSFPGIGNVIASDVVRVVSHLHSKDIVQRDIKQCPVPIIKVTNTKNWRWCLAKNLLSVNLVIWGKRDLCIHRLAGKKCTTAFHRESLSFMVPELITEELSIASGGTDDLKTVDVWVVSMTFFTILNPDQSYPFQNALKNIPNKVTSNMEAASKQ